MPGVLRRLLLLTVCKQIPDRIDVVQIVDGTMTVDTIITVRYGCSVVAVAKAVQESVTSAVESMTGMGKPIVNVHVSGVAFDK